MALVFARFPLAGNAASSVLIVRPVAAVRLVY